MTAHVEGRFIGAAGKQIYWQGWLPDGDPTPDFDAVHATAVAQFKAAETV